MHYLLKASLAGLLLFTARVVSAQTAAEPPILNHIAVYVHDLEQSTAFYKDVLQLKQIPEPFHDGRHTWYSLGQAGQLHLIQGEAENASYDKNNHLCFSVSDIDSFISRLTKMQIGYTNWPGTANAPTIRVDGVKQIYFQDPDGHWIEVNNDR